MVWGHERVNIIFTVIFIMGCLLPPRGGFDRYPLLLKPCRKKRGSWIRKVECTSRANRQSMYCARPVPTAPLGPGEHSHPGTHKVQVKPDLAAARAGQGRVIDNNQSEVRSTFHTSRVSLPAFGLRSRVLSLESRVSVFSLQSSVSQGMSTYKVVSHEQMDAASGTANGL